MISDLNKINFVRGFQELEEISEESVDSTPWKNSEGTLYISPDCIYILIRNNRKDEKLYHYTEATKNEFMQKVKSSYSQYSTFTNIEESSDKKVVYYSNPENFKTAFNDNVYIDMLFNLKSMGSPLCLIIDSDAMQASKEELLISLIALAINIPVYYVYGDDTVKLSDQKMKSLIKSFSDILYAKSLPAYITSSINRTLRPGRYLVQFKLGNVMGLYDDVFQCEVSNVLNTSDYKSIPLETIDKHIQKRFSNDNTSLEPFVEMNTISLAEHYNISDSERQIPTKAINPIDAILGEGSPFDSFFNTELKPHYLRYFNSLSSATMNVGDIKFPVKNNYQTFERLCFEYYLSQIISCLELMAGRKERLFASDLVAFVSDSGKVCIGFTTVKQVSRKDLVVEHQVKFHNEENTTTTKFNMVGSEMPVVKPNLPGIIDINNNFEEYTEEESKTILVAVLHTFSCFINHGSFLPLIPNLQNYVKDNIMDDTTLAYLKRRLLLYWSRRCSDELIPTNYHFIQSKLTGFHMDCFGMITAKEARGDSEKRELLVRL